MRQASPWFPRAALLFWLCALLAGCGFQLRGSTTLPFSSVYIDIHYVSPIVADLKRNLTAMTNVKVVDIRSDAEAVLTNFSETRNKQILSINSAGRAREFRLSMRITYAVLDQKGITLVPPGDLIIERDFSFNDNAVLAKESEEALLYRDMQSDLVQQMIRRLGAVKPGAVMTEPAKG